MVVVFTDMEGKVKKSKDYPARSGYSCTLKIKAQGLQ